MRDRLVQQLREGVDVRLRRGRIPWPDRRPSPVAPGGASTTPRGPRAARGRGRSRRRSRARGIPSKRRPRRPSPSLPKALLKSNSSKLMPARFNASSFSALSPTRLHWASLRFHSGARGPRPGARPRALIEFAAASLQPVARRLAVRLILAIFSLPYGAAAACGGGKAGSCYWRTVARGRFRSRRLRLSSDDALSEHCYTALCSVRPRLRAVLQAIARTASGVRQLQSLRPAPAARAAQASRGKHLARVY